MVAVIAVDVLIENFALLSQGLPWYGFGGWRIGVGGWGEAEERPDLLDLWFVVRCRGVFGCVVCLAKLILLLAETKMNSLRSNSSV